MEHIQLTTVEKNTAVWLKVERYLDELIETARKKNDAPLNHDETTELRGRIRAFKALKSLGDDVPFMEEDPLPE